MSFISYAQNLEDVMLYRAFKHIEHGFYIDVGASHPVLFSVTKAFYDRGWHGINVEPSFDYFSLLEQERAEDVNLNQAVSNHNGSAIFYDVFPGLSSLNKDYANFHAKMGHKISTSVISCTTLDAICERYKVDIIHFLKIDAEGMEKEVLEGFSLTSIRPWIIVIEANAPFSTQDVSQEWASIILGKKYKMVYYDGLNQFYVAEEHSDFRVYFGAPPNVFDDYVTYELIKEREEQEHIKTQLLEECRRRREMEAKLQSVFNSWSWQITMPLRKVKSIVNSILKSSSWKL